MSVSKDDARETCKAIMDPPPNMYNSLNHFIDAFNPLNWIKAIGNDNETKKMAVKMTEIGISMDDSKKIIDECKNETMSAQSNIIDTEECRKPLIEACKMLLPNQRKYADCIDSVIKMKPRISNINQSNISTIKNNCVIQKVVDKLLQQNATAENLAKVIALQEGSGLFNKNKTDIRNCDIIKNNISSKTLLESVARCINKTNTKQSNIIKACGDVSDVIQKNNNDIFNECMINEKIIDRTSQSTDAINKTEDDLKNKGTNTALFMSLFIVGGIVAIIVAIIAIKYALK